MAAAITLRPAKLSDKEDIRVVCLQTAANGYDASQLFHFPETLWALYTDPYLTHDLDTCFVAEDQQGVCGYSLAALDAAKTYAWALSTWLPVLCEKFPLDADADYTPADYAMAGLIHNPYPLPPQISEYPSEMHIDLLPRAQGKGIGRKLIKILTEKLFRLGSTGVLLGVSGENRNAIAFYEYLGFDTLQTNADGSRQMGLKLPAHL